MFLKTVNLILVLLSVLSVTLKSCPDGNFKCKTGECVPAKFVCNFKVDCKDGSDEEFCGSCTFEKHSCGWNSPCDTTYCWKRQRANITLIPGLDHTSGSPFGHVMHIDGKQGSIFETAILEHSVDKVAALGCQLRFWYHIYEEHAVSSSSHLEVKLVRDTAVNLLDISKTTNGWENATVFIGNQPGGYKLQFSLKCSFFGCSSVMLDDISFENCGEGDIPTGSEKLSCDFEKGTCSWYHDYTASLLWKRSRGAYGGPSGNGYYMLIESQRGLNISSKARLISFPQPAGQVICVTFNYHIFGNSIGSLRFIVKHPGEPEQITWIRSGTQGNKWRFADLTFTSDKPIQFIIEAEVGGKQGTISIDDIVVYSSDKGSCPAERECTFQGSLCGMQPDPTADFSWIRIKGTSQPDNSSGPHTDHTLETDQGYYLSAQLWSHPSRSSGQMMTAMMEPTPPDGECLMFWYYMEGRNVGRLSVYLRTLDNDIKLWTRSGDQGSHWRHGRVDLLSTDTAYQVIFEAVAGDGPRRDIAIDDLTVLNGACPPPDFCDFEMDFCGWVNSPPTESAVDWDWLSASSEGRLIPNKDHSTHSSLGHFAFFMAFNSEKEEIARLESEPMGATKEACLEFWHHASGWSINTPSVITLTVFLNETSGLHPIWQMNGYRNSSWIKEKISYSATDTHKIILQARCPPSEEESFALDDVRIIRNRSCIDTIPTPSPIPSTTAAPPPESVMTCSFEKGLCDWIQDVNYDFKWTLSNGLNAAKPWDGPQYDHSVGNYEGNYLLLKGAGLKDGERAAIAVAVSNFPSDICVGFWHYMLGPSVSTLDLLVETKSSKHLVWTQSGTQNPKWTNVQVTINRNDTIWVMFTGHRNSNSQGFIAIDDISLTDGPCSSQDICGFESSWCSFENDVSYLGRWERKRGSTVDHTYGTKNGFYMSVMKSNSTYREEAHLLTSELNPRSEICVRFWYWLTAEASSILSVHVMQSGAQGQALWQQSGSSVAGWEVAEVTVSSPGIFRVAFKAVHMPGTNYTIQIDDFSMRNGACPPSGTCDFESGQCNWVNIPTEDGHEWVLASGAFQGPLTDHTTDTPDGRFLLSLPQHQSTLAQVASERIEVRDATFCLTLWYHINSSIPGALKVLMHSGRTQELIFESNGSQHSWTRFSKTLEGPKHFKLLLKAQPSKGGFIAVDDISLEPGLCQVNETSLGFMGCTFENGTCDWKDISAGQYQWVRGRNTGPSVDHTLGTKLGWFMAIESERGEKISPAVLQSPIMKEASATCTLHFYHNMYQEDIKKLNVLLMKNQRATTLWWHPGNTGNIWQHGEVRIGRSHQDFTIIFEASRTFNKPGHIAIDDINFTGCTLPEPSVLCPENLFTCNNNVCIEKHQVCDFSDDCGDRSDENSCEQYGVEERCSFEQGLCSWTNSEVDTPGSEWTHHSGQDAWPDHGPPRDHTLNNGAGHYIIPGIYLTKKGQTSEILSKTLLPSTNCTIRFFFYGLDDTAAGLTAKSRTLQSGNNDNLLWQGWNSRTYSWQKGVVTVSSSYIFKVVFSYEILKDTVEGQRRLVALDDVSFSKDCVIDPSNGKLPDTSPTAAPSTSTQTPTPVTATTNPCQDNFYFCWRSPGNVCIPAVLHCDYHLDCPQGEDEDGCGPCSFEIEQCQWLDISHGKTKWKRQKATNNTQPSSDHTTNTGYYMQANFNKISKQSEARLQSPTLPPSSPFCQILFHFYISPECAGSLRVLMQQADGSEAILWSRSHNTVSHWTSEYLPLGQHLQAYKILFSCSKSETWGNITSGDCVFALDDITFLDCEQSFQPPALQAFNCSFENGLCQWVQGAEDELDWILRSGPTDTPNTGPAGDHTTGKGKYLYIKSSPPSVKRNVAQLKSSLLLPTGEKGYCFTFWYHMFGATVGSLMMLLQTADPLKKTLVWQKSGNQGDEWLFVQSHVTLQDIHQVILAATVGGEAGDIAIDDISLLSGPCPASDLCDFEGGSCNWQQQTSDDTDWVRHSGPTANPNTGPDSDHTTNTPAGHYYYLPSSAADSSGEAAVMFSPLYPPGRGACLQLWYHMYGKGVGTLKVYQENDKGNRFLIFSQSGDQGKLWRFAQASLMPLDQPKRIVVEGVKVGPTQEGDMAFDDVWISDAQCPPDGYCNFETNMCSWSNLGGGVDQGDWLRGRGASPNPSTGPSFDHTTNSTNGYYLYVDSSVGLQGDLYFLISDVLQPSARGHCLQFWYHMFGDHVGTLRVYLNDRKVHTNKEEFLKWSESGNKGDMWLMANVFIKPEKTFQFVLAYQRGKTSNGNVALDDITILPGSCYSEPPPKDNIDMLYVCLAVGLTFFAGCIICIILYMLHRKHHKLNQPNHSNSVTFHQNSVFDFYDCKIDGTNHGTDFHFSFNNLKYDLSPHAAEETTA